jgi:hypothetical protein
MTETPFIFFDLGQTLVDEWRFIEYIENKLLEVLNGFGQLGTMSLGIE